MKTGLLIATCIVTVGVVPIVLRDLYVYMFVPWLNKRRERIEQKRYWAGYVYVRVAFRSGRNLRSLEDEAHQDFPFYNNYERGMFDAISECEADIKLRDRLNEALKAARCE